MTSMKIVIRGYIVLAMTVGFLGCFSKQLNDDLQSASFTQSGSPPAKDEALSNYLSILEHCEDEGFDREDFSYSALVAASRAQSPALSKLFENSFRSYVRSLALGRIDPAWVGHGWERSNEGASVDSGELFSRLQAGETIDYDSLGPQDERFRRLRIALKSLRAMKRNVLSDPEHAALDDQINRVILNLERWRWLPQNLGAKYVEVNIPSYELSTFVEGKVALQMRVIVGKESWPTPILRSRITAVEINPDWDVPRSIAVRELLPKLRKDSAYLERNHLIIIDEHGQSVKVPHWSSVSGATFPYRFRQTPGSWNSLGQMKFVFQSSYGVYLHGTPAKELFEKDSRSLSHGCIRIENPLALAELAFENSKWNRQRIQEMINAGATYTLGLETSLPVYLTYWTAWVDEEQHLQFADDVYGGDSAMKRVLENRFLGMAQKTSNRSEAETGSTSSYPESRQTKNHRHP